MTERDTVEVSHIGADFTGIEQPQVSMLAAEVALSQIASRETDFRAEDSKTDSDQLKDDLNNGHYDTA